VSCIVNIILISLCYHHHNHHHYRHHHHHHHYQLLVSVDMRKLRLVNRRRMFQDTAFLCYSLPDHAIASEIGSSRPSTSNTILWCFVCFCHFYDLCIVVGIII
jgi:hypothetical protein